MDIGKSHFNKIIIFFKFLVIIYSVGIFVVSFHYFNLESIRHMLFKSDAYINYAGGFMRRGIDGELIYHISKNFNITPWKLQAIYSIITLFFFTALTIYVSVRYKIAWITLLSMSCLLCLIWYSKSGIRKDHIILSLILIYFLIIGNSIKNSLKLKKIIILNIVLIISILIHEIAFLYCFAPIVLYLYKKNSGRNRKELIKTIFFLTFFPFIVFFTCTFIRPGTHIMEQKIIESWSELGVRNIKFWTGVFEKPYYIWRFAKSPVSYFYIVFAFCFHWLFVWLSAGAKLKDSGTKKNFTIVLTIQFLISLLITIFASDFSRWLVYSTFTSVFFVFIMNDFFSNNKPSNPLKFQYFFVLQYFLIGLPFSTEAGIENYFNSLPINILLEKLSINLN